MQIEISDIFNARSTACPRVSTQRSFNSVLTEFYLHRLFRVVS